MKMKAYTTFDEYLAGQPPRNQIVVRALRDPNGLLEGEGKFVRHIKVRKRADIDERAFAALLRQAAQ